ncbi:MULTISPECIES: type II toxin-antitoxin system RelE/ParE family toxin [unclassified Rhizobium]|jgi:plasmid stabilization system protein ParE|uniref:type II toxin-antitoxin system RelE/ParE family toxin n=1 Tax=Rhizobium sp. GCM10022189 TaxID=3252654 RepID=UPI000DD90061
MPQLRFLQSAKADIGQIFRFIAGESGNRAVARNFTDKLIQKCSELASLPGQMGRPRPELGDGIRSFAYNNYVIIFRYAGNDFEVVKVFEGHRDIDAHFNVQH